MLLFEFDVIVAQADVVGLEVNVLVGIADAIDLVADEFTQLGHIARIGTKIEQVERRTRRTLDDNLARISTSRHHTHLYALTQR